MKRVPRADSALTVPWRGITGVPDTVTQPPAAVAPVVQRIIPAAVPQAAVPQAQPQPQFTIAKAYFNWAPGAIAPGQTVATTVRVGAVLPGAPCVVGTPYALPFGQVSACVSAFQTVQVNVTNLSNAAATLAAGDWRVLVFIL